MSFSFWLIVFKALRSFVKHLLQKWTYNPKTYGGMWRDVFAGSKWTVMITGYKL